MPKASDNKFPKVIIEEGTTPATPAAGTQKLFIDSADHTLKLVDESDVVTEVGGTDATAIHTDVDSELSGLTEEVSPASGDWFLLEKSTGAKRKVDVDNLPGGGGGINWNQVVNESGASFTNFTSITGTWSSDGSVIKQTDTTNSNFTAKYNTKIVNALMIMEAEIQIKTAGSDKRAGFVLGFNGTSSTNAMAIVLIGGTNEVSTAVLDLAWLYQHSQTINTDTWYKLRVVQSGHRLTVYLDGVVIFSYGGLHTGQVYDQSFIGLTTYGALAWFRNIKVWNLDMPA